MALRNLTKGSLLVIFIGFVIFAGCESPTSLDDSIEDTSIESETPSYGIGADINKNKGIPGQYIVVLNKNVKDVDNSAKKLEKASGGKVKHLYKKAIKGFSISFNENASPKALEALKNNPNVDYIEQDIELYAFETQTNVTWGLDRTDQRNLPLDDTYNYLGSGESVTVYILDSGINYSHVDFGGRASFGFDTYGGDGSDCDGHGTHVAGTVGGSQWGIAKNVNLVSVRVLDCNGDGTLSGVVAGIDWVTTNASGPSVANMSLGGSESPTLDTAVENSIASGITYVVAAGNSGADACNYSPSGAPNALTIGATTSADSRASFSNYGSCVDLFAPGSGITSAGISSDTSTDSKSGTSMATPHVAGVVALYLQSNSTATPEEVETALLSYSTKNIVSNSNSTNNHLVYSIFDDSGDGGGTINSAPVAGFTYNTSDLSVQLSDESTDPDGTISAWSWDFGDGNSSTSQNPSHTYSQGGTYTVSLTVTDDSGDSDTASETITVTEALTNSEPIINTFSINAYNNGPWNKVDITWSVADDDSNLSMVKSELLSGTSVIESATSNVSGGSASGLHDLKTRNSADAVRLTVTDSYGNSVSSTKNLDGSGSGDGGNTAPDAGFTYSVDILDVQFSDQSTDSDGSISTWSWNFGDGSSSTSQNPSHAYGQAGTYTVTLIVTDNSGDTDTVSKSVTVNQDTGGGFSVSANGYKRKAGYWTVDLTWSGAASTNVDVYRDGSLISTVNNSGSHTDYTDFKGGGSPLTYKVCEAGTSNCSNETTVIF